MKKRILSSLLAICLLLTVLPATALAISAEQFIDVTTDDWFYEDVAFVSAKGYFQGTSDTTFSPNMTMTRAMFVTVLSRLDNADVDNGISVFTDVPAGMWYTGAVNWAVSNNIVVGNGNNMFAPEQPITREQMCVIMARFVDYYGQKTNQTHKKDREPGTFADAEQISSYAVDAVLDCYSWGLINGYPDGSFGPNEPSTRAQVAAVIHRLDWILESSGESDDTVPGGNAGSSETYQYTITYDANGGSGAPSVQSVSGKTASLIAALSTITPVWSGYSFTGWCTDRDGNGVVYAAGEQVELSGSITLYAVWAAVIQESGRETISLNGAWTFTDYDGNSSPVTVPHSWEYTNMSAYSPAGSIKTCTYEREVDVSAYSGKELFLQFDGVNKIAVVYVDGVEIGRHTGGFTAFAIDITDACEGKDCVTVQVETINISMDTMPVNTDFTHFAGIYRDVNLVAVNKSGYLALEDSGTQGVYLETSVDLSDDSASLSPTVMISYRDINKVREITVTTTLKSNDGSVVGSSSTKLDASGSAAAVEIALTDISVENVHLWQGTEDPYLYTVETTVSVDGQKTDFNSQKIGFRTYAVDDGVFYLNGREYELRGVGMHQEYGGETNAVSDDQRRQDIATVLEMGANALRTCHYPHDQYTYELCDEEGIVVWCEIPFYLVMLDTQNFRDNVIANATEMVKQGFNHPSIIIWGIQNEVNYYEQYKAYYNQPSEEDLGTFMKELAQTVKSLDSSRMIGEAEIDNTAFSEQTASWTTEDSGIDAVGFNLYTGWYSNVNGATTENKFNRIISAFKSKLNTYQKRFDDSSNNTVSYVLTEYGAGANINQHDSLGENFQWGGTDSSKGYVTSEQYHPEEYQSYVHEGMFMAIYGDETNNIQPADNLWCAFAWSMFDFSSFRNEGGLTRTNTKGLITADRSTKKDAFYLYKANWNDSDYFTHICSSRYNNRPTEAIDVKVYSNCDSVELFVNDVSYGNGTRQQDGVFVWENVKLDETGGANTVIAIGEKDGITYSDVCDSWVYGRVPQIMLNQSLDKVADGTPVMLDYNVFLLNGTVDITEDANSTVAWYKLVSADSSDYPDYPGYPDYPDYPEYPGYDDSYGGSYKMIPLSGAPSEPGKYLCRITVPEGDNGAYSWTSAFLDVPFEIFDN